MSLKFWTKVLSVTVIALFVTTMAWPQSGSKTGPKYDASKEVTVKGTVQEVRQTPDNITELVVKSGDKTVQVYLAPAEFLKEIECWVKAGDQIEVVGAKAPDTDELLARAITLGNDTMTLRDPKGVPTWTGWKPSKS